VRMSEHLSVREGNKDEESLSILISKLQRTAEV
jgi:hypothetical protein